ARPAGDGGAPPFAELASSPLAGLLMWGMAAAPAAEFAQLDPVRRVPPGLVRLIVAALALLAGEGHADSNVRGHFSSTSLRCRQLLCGRTEKNPRPQARGGPKNSDRHAPRPTAGGRRTLPRVDTACKA